MRCRLIKIQAEKAALKLHSQLQQQLLKFPAEVRQMSVREFHEKYACDLDAMGREDKQQKVAEVQELFNRMDAEFDKIRSSRRAKGARRQLQFPQAANDGTEMDKASAV